MGDNLLRNQYAILKLISGIILGGVGGVVLIKTNTSRESLSAIWIGLSAGLGLVAGLADHIDPLQRVFERGQWLLTGIAILFVFMASLNYVGLPLLISLTLGFGSGVLIGTSSVVAIQTARSHRL